MTVEHLKLETDETPLAHIEEGSTSRDQTQLDETQIEDETPQERELKRLNAIVEEKLAVFAQQEILTPAATPPTKVAHRSLPDRLAGVPIRDKEVIPRKESTTTHLARTYRFRKHRIKKGSEAEQLAFQLTGVAVDRDFEELKQNSPHYKRDLQKLISKGYKYSYSREESWHQEKPFEPTDNFLKYEERELKDSELTNIPKVADQVENSTEKIKLLSSFGLSEAILTSLDRRRSYAGEDRLAELVSFLNTEESIALVRKLVSHGISFNHINSGNSYNSDANRFSTIAEVLADASENILPVLEAGSNHIAEARKLSELDQENGSFTLFMNLLKFFNEGGSPEELASMSTYISTHPPRDYRGELEPQMKLRELTQTSLQHTQALKQVGLFEEFLAAQYLYASLPLYGSGDFQDLTHFLTEVADGRFGTRDEVAASIKRYAAVTGEHTLSPRSAHSFLYQLDNEPTLIPALVACSELKAAGALEGDDLFTAANLAPYVTNPNWVATYTNIHAFAAETVSKRTSRPILENIRQLSEKPEVIERVTSEPFCHFITPGYQNQYTNIEDLNHYTRLPNAEVAARAILKRVSNTHERYKELSTYSQEVYRNPDVFSDPEITEALISHPYYNLATDGINAYFKDAGQTPETLKTCLDYMETFGVVTAGNILKLNANPDGKQYGELVAGYLATHGKEQADTLYSNFAQAFIPHATTEAHLERILAIFNRRLPGDFVMNNRELLLEVPGEKFETYLNVSERLRSSCCQELIRVENELMPVVLASDNPMAAYEKIEKVFLRNNLPYLGKAYSVFNILYPPAVLNGKLNEKSSPVLQKASTRERYHILYNDLVKVQVASGNRSLENYASLLAQYEGVLTTAEEKSFENLSEEETTQLRNFAEMLGVLFDNSTYKRMFSEAGTSETSQVDLRDSLNQLRQDLGVPEGGSIIQRLHEMFLRASNSANFSELAAAMRESRQTADAKNRSFSQEHRKLGVLGEGTLVKGFSAAHISSILQNGSVAKEFLGGGSSSDMTPLDTDLEMIHPSEESSDGARVLSRSKMASGYGELKMFMSEPPEGYELFETLGAGHMGIRTGFPLTMIDGLICSDDPIHPSVMDYKVAITENGYYIPIYSEDGSLIFTPEEFDNLKQAYRGLKRFNAPPLEPQRGAFITDSSTPGELMKDQEQVSQTFNSIQATISEILTRHGVTLRSQDDHSLTGAELESTGSTGRGTNKPGDYDFDLSLRLDPLDFQKLTAADITQELRDAFNPESEMNSNPGDATTQYRFFGAKVGEVTADIDIAFTQKSELQLFATHQAIQERLSSIADPGIRSQVASDIIWIKKQLSERNVYKKGNHAGDENQVGGQGGLGGVGVETWILNHNGSTREAMASFASAAYNPDGTLKPLEEFQVAYPIIDAGVNLRNKRHDNYVRILSEESYAKMAAFCRDMVRR